MTAFDEERLARLIRGLFEEIHGVAKQEESVKKYSTSIIHVVVLNLDLLDFPIRLDQFVSHLQQHAKGKVGFLRFCRQVGLMV